MKLLKSILTDCQHLLFLDLEGTQFSHEVISIGAVLVDCDKEFKPVGKPTTFKCYVKALSDIGAVISSMTGITDEILQKEGISFSEAMSKLNEFLGNKSSYLKVLTYGNQDANMLACSLRLDGDNSPFLKSFVKLLIRNNVDAGTIFSRYIRGKKNELVSLTHMREFFSLEPAGMAHDPLVDSLDLYHVYQSFTSDKKIVEDSYKKLIRDSNIIPQPIKAIVVDILNGKTVSSSDLDKVLDIYFE